MYTYLVAFAWLYVALMMAAAEAASPVGSVLGALITFLLYGVGPVALVVYILNTPARKRALKARQARQEQTSAQPDAGGHAAADPVAPVRKEP